MQKNKLALFEEREIRRKWYNEDWYFSVEDVVQVLTDSVDVKQYIKKLKARDEELNNNWGTICTLVEMTAKDGKRRKIRTADTKGILRIIQSIPSPKAEPFKLWLAQVGSERLDEIVNPELAINRAKDRDYAILTDEIYKSTFNMNTTQYKELKGINKTKRNLRDSMGKLELAITNLSEVTANEMHNTNNSFGLEELKDDVQEAGKITGKARKEIEGKIGKKVAEKENYRNLTQNGLKQIKNKEESELR